MKRELFKKNKFVPCVLSFLLSFQFLWEKLDVFWMSYKDSSTKYYKSQWISAITWHVGCTSRSLIQFPNALKVNF